MAILCSSALVFSLAISASAAELSPEDAPGKIVVGMVVEVTDEEVTLEVRDTGRDGMAEAPEAPETPEGEPAADEPLPEKLEGEPADGDPRSEKLKGEPIDGEQPSVKPVNGKPVNAETPNEHPTSEPVEGAAAPEPPQNEEPSEQPEGKPEEDEPRPEKAQFDDEDNTFVLSVADLSDLDPEVGDMLCVVLDTDGTVVSVELLQMDVMPINDEKVTK